MANQNPIITIEMADGGVMKLELYPDTAPNTVRNFISLVKKNFYDGLSQGGDPDGNGMGGPDYNIPGEFSSNGFENPLKHDAGVISMARAQHPDSAGSQFFIMHKNSPHLDGQYAAFGKIIEGMDIVNRIAETPTDFSDAPVEKQIMKKVTAECFDVDYPEPETC